MHDVALGHRETCCPLPGSFATRSVMAGARGRQPGWAGEGAGVQGPSAAGDGSRPGSCAGQPARQLSPTIPYWLLMGFPARFLLLWYPHDACWSPGCLCLVPESMWLQKWKGKHHGRMPGALESCGGQSLNSCIQNHKKLLTFLLTVCQFPSYPRRRKSPIRSICIGAEHRS